jgi:hypothetical protein
MLTALLILWIAGLPLTWGLLIRNGMDVAEASALAMAWPMALIGLLTAALLGLFGDEEEF